MRKRGGEFSVIICFLVAVMILVLAFNSGIVSAVCDPSQTIMKLYNPLNSHAAKWDATLEICNGKTSLTDYCSGSYTYCANFASPISPWETRAPPLCNSETGMPPCTYQDPNNCASLGETSCRANSGCIWTVTNPITGAGTCGAGISCSMFNSPSLCTKPGCSWSPSPLIGVCYNDIFEEPSGSTSHTCQNGNNVIWLNKIFNSHASITQSSTYNTPVCFGNLRCQADISPGDVCANGGSVVVRLSAESNAHVQYSNEVDKISYWNFENNLEDSADGNNAVFNGGSEVYADGNDAGKKAIVFDGTSKNLTIPDNQNLHFGNKANISVLVKPSGNGGPVFSFESYDSTGNLNGVFGLYLSSTDGVTYVLQLLDLLKQYLNGVETIVQPAKITSANSVKNINNAWHRINVYVDGSIMTFDVDGDTFTVVPTVYGGITHYPISFPFSWTIASFRIGSISGAIGDSSQRYFNGAIDEFAVYKTDGSGANFPVKICCNMGAELGGAYWANMMDEIIPSSGNVVLGSRVKLKVSGENLESKMINYTVYKDRWYWVDKKVATDSTTGFTTWKASELGNNYKFKAKIEGQSEEAITPYPISVIPGVISPPKVKILGTKDKQIYFINELLNFTAEIKDPAGYVNYVWTLGNDGTRAGNTETYSNYSFMYAFSTPGQKNIDLTGVNEQGQKNKSRVSILVVNSSYILAYIDNPLWRMMIPSMFVSFNASSTYAVNYSREDGTITCLAGNCPSRSEGCPGSYPRSDYTNCRISVTGTPNPIGFENINFSWNFDDDTSKSGKGTAGAVVKKPFGTLGEHNAILKTSLNPESETDQSFIVGGPITSGPNCDVATDRQGRQWIYSNAGVVPSENDCYREDGVNFKKCCPVNSGCDTSTNPAKCVQDPPGCSKYKSQNACEGSDGTDGSDDINEKMGSGYCGRGWGADYEKAGVMCQNFTGDCRCSWKNGVCIANSTFYTACEGRNNVDIGHCEFATDYSGECSLGYRTINWTGNWIGITERNEEVCPFKSEKRVPCLAQLGFFSAASVIILIVLIIIFYYFIGKREKDAVSVKKGKKKRDMKKS